MNLLVAVSGGVDSVVLLDILSRGDDQLVVCHVDHGIRDASAEDARFVQALASRYALPYVQTELDLGERASEETARGARYEFLKTQAEKFAATIVTAHHRDDLVGSIAINLARGTGWRGLGVMNRADIKRPLIGWTKSKIYDYALTYRLEWVEDATNSSSRYLRNRLRADVLALDEQQASELTHLRARQLQLARDIDTESKRLIASFAGSRYAYTHIDQSVAIELLRTLIDQKTGYRPTAEQAERTLLAIKTARDGSRHDIAAGVKLLCKAGEFLVERP